MGLDMYLFIREREFRSKHYGYGKLKLKYPKEILNVFTNLKDENYTDEKVWDDRSVSRSTDYKIGYWRKQNAIHNWFVNNCADGRDECQEIYVYFDDLKKLYELCDAVMKDHSKASELLPTQSGFFFGGTEYDEWYFNGIKYTMEVLEKTLTFLKTQEDKKSNKDFQVIYNASW